MNPTTCLFVKLSILVALSCQVLGSDLFGDNELLVKLEALHQPTGRLRRRQVELGGVADVRADAKGEAAQKSNAPGAKDNKKDGEAVSKEEQLATKLFEGIIDVGAGLEGVTNLGSTTKEIVDQSKKVAELLPKVKVLTTDLLSAAPKKSEELTKSVEESNKASEAITKSLGNIEAKADDANVIKQEYKNLEKSFLQILKTSDGIAVAAIPKLAELAKQEEAAEKANGENKEVSKAEGKNGEAQHGANAAVALDKKEEGKKAEAGPKPAGEKSPLPEKNDEPKLGELAVEPKAPAPAGPEPKAAAPAGAEPKAIEPIDPGVVVV